MNKLLRNKKGAALVEYALVVAGVALISAAAVSIFGHKTSDMLAATATVLPGAHADDNGPIVSGKLIETTGADAGTISLDINGINTNSDTPRLGNNLLGGINGPNLTNLVVEGGDAVGGGGGN